MGNSKHALTSDVTRRSFVGNSPHLPRFLSQPRSWLVHLGHLQHGGVSHIGVMHHLSTLVHKGGVFLHMRYTTWAYERERWATVPAARSGTEAPESLCFQGASP